MLGLGSQGQVDHVVWATQETACLPLSLLVCELGLRLLSLRVRVGCERAL